jgi:hypothetical protein
MFPWQRKTRNSPLLGNGSVRTFLGKRIDSVTEELFEMVRLEISSVQENSVGSDSSLLIRHSGREGTRSPVRNGEKAAP